MANFYDPRHAMYPSGNLNYLPHLSASMNGQSLLQALSVQQQQMQQQQAPASSAHRQQSQQIPSTTTAQNQAILQQHAYFAALQQLSQQEQNKALAQLSQPHLQSLLSNSDLARMTPQQLQLLQTQLQSPATNASRPSMMSSFPVQTNSPQVNTMIKQEPKQMYGLTTGVPYRPAANNLSVPGSMIRTPDVNTSPAPNRANTLLSNIHAAQPSHHLLVDEKSKQERQNVRDRLDKVNDDQKTIEAQLTTASKRRQHLMQMLENRKIEMKEAEAEAAAARQRAALNAEANKNKIPLIDRIAMENRQQTEKNDPPTKLLPTVKHCHNSNAIYNNYKKLGPALIRAMTDSKIRAQKKRDDYLVNYEEKYLAWLRRVDKYEKTPKKAAKDQKNRELFEKIFPEIKKDREERERNERHERNNVEEAIPKSKEEKAAERACHVPFYCPQKPRHAFKNMNNEVEEQELKNVNDDLSTFISHWSPAERTVFINKIKTYWKNFHVLSNFYWDRTTCDLVRYFYATKSEMKYKLTFPKTKKKVAKAYKPTPMPDFREMYDYLMSTCDLKSTFQKLPCLICSNDVHLFGETLPKMRPEKEKLRRKISKEQEYREKMPICNKCYNTYKKPSIRCPVGNGHQTFRRNKPSRAIPSEFTELSVDDQSLIVRKLQFHPGAPKICANCHKRILHETKSIKAGTFVYDASMDNRRSSVNKKQLNWTFDRVEALFRAASDPSKTWDAVSTQICADNFKPSARQCRVVHTKLSNYWHIKKSRVHLESSSRRLRRMYRHIKRATKLEYEQNQKLRVIADKQSVNKSLSGNLKSPTQGGQHGSLTQGIPVARTPVSVPNAPPMLANFIPTASQPSTSTMASPPIQPGIQIQLQDEKWARYLMEELGLPKGSSTDDHSAEIAHRVSLMSPYDFEMLQNRLKVRAQQDQEASTLAKFKQLNRHHFDHEPKEQELRVSQSPRLDNAHLANASSVVQYTTAKSAEPAVEDTSRQTASAERPNRKTGLANVMLETNNGGFRSRTHTLQKNTINRPSSAFDSQQVKLEQPEPPTDNEDLKLKQNKAANNGAYPQRQTAPVTTNVEEPAYESLSEDDDDNQKAKEPEASVSTQPQKSPWRRLLTLFSLENQELPIPPCPKHFQMPAIETLTVSSPYDDLSD